MNKHARWNLLLAMTLILSVSCTKKREDRLAQTAGIDAQTVNSVKDWKHSLTTTKAKFTPNKSVSEKDLKVSEDVADLINNYPLVEYTTDSDLLGNDIPLRGRPDFKYEVRYELGDSSLRVLKVGHKKDIPSEEWTYAVQLEDGLLGVPVVGYSLQYFKIGNYENEDREKTNTLIELPVADRDQASHVRIDRQSRTVFEAVQKVDIYPAEYFKGEWYYQATVVQTQIGQEAMITAGGAFDTKLNGAEKVQIRLDNRKTLLGVNANLDAKIDKDSTLDQGYVFSIPIEWKEFEAAKSGRGFGLREDSVERRVEIERPYIKVDFEKHFSPSDLVGAASGFGWLIGQATGEQKLVDVQLAKDYFSFTLLKSGSGLKIRYAFRRNLNSNYKDIRPYDEKDAETFGYFYTVPNLVLTRDYQTKTDVQRFFKMNRFNPEQREIVYHFSKESPRGNQRGAWVREMGRYAVHFWDQAFKKAGVNIRVRLDETMDVDLGDLRYNVLHIIDPLTYTGLGGLGPSVADPNTGEIVSATSNILVSPYTEGMASGIRKYIRNQLSEQLLKIRDFGKASDTVSLENRLPLDGRLPLRMDEKGTFKPLWLATYQKGEIRNMSVGLKPEQDALIDRYLRATGSNSKASALTVEQKLKLYDAMIADQRFGMQAASLANGSIYSQGVTTHLNERIKKECPAVDKFIAKAKASGGDFDPNTEVDTVEACTMKLARLPLLAVFLHEMGHNFSLAHNFKCSADPGKNRENFWTADEIREEFQGLNGEAFPEEFLPQGKDPIGSCVMDYMSEDIPILPVPGKYDIAAIRFIYKGQVETSSGEMKPLYRNENGVKKWLPIRTAVGQASGLLKPLAYCSDMDNYLGIDPLCRQHDTGETPEQVVDNVIAAYWTSIENTTYSYDRLNAPELAMAPQSRARYLVQLKRIYDEWRFHLSQFLGPDNGYLESISSEDYPKVLERMSKSNFSKKYAEYKPARDKIVSFMFQLAFLSNRYCLGTTPNDNLKAMELSSVIEQVGFFGHNGAIRCSDKASQDVLAANGISLVKEFGNSSDEIYFSNSPRALEEAPDVFGTMTDRIMSATFMTMRLNQSLVNESKRLFPAMIDEPDVRDRMLGYFTDRLMNGVNVSPYLKGISKLEKLPREETTLRLFKRETPLLNFLSQMLPMSLIVPGKLTQSQNALALFAINRASTPNEVKSVQEAGAAIFQMPTGGILYAMPDNVISYQFINRLNSLSSELQLHSEGIKEEELKSVVSQVSTIFPEKGKDLTMLDVFNTVNVISGLMSNAQVSVGTRTIVFNTLLPFYTLLQKFDGGKFAQLFEQYSQGKAQEAQAEAGKLDPNSEEGKQLANLKAQIQDFERQMTGLVMTNFVKQAGGFVDKEEFAAAINQQVKGVARLLENQKEELDAHQDVLRSAIITW